MHQLREFLAKREFDEVAIDHAVAEVAAAGFLDDERYARRFAEDKRELDKWGRERIERTLVQRGIDGDVIETALGERERDTELATALELLEAKMAPPDDDRSRQKAWQLLVRRGYEPELAYDAVRAHAAAG